MSSENSGGEAGDDIPPAAADTLGVATASDLKVFRYLPPAPQEQRAFALQFLGSILALAAIAGLVLAKVHFAPNAGVVWGASAGIVYTIARAAWRLENKAQRAARSQIGIAADGLHLTDERGKTSVIAWTTFTRFDVIGGRLTLEWPDGKFAVGSREIEDGMTLVREVMQSSGRIAKPAPSNFIPLEPR